MPVDFEVVNVDSSVASEDDINDAITAIRRNGVALKGVKHVFTHLSDTGLYLLVTSQI